MNFSRDGDGGSAARMNFVAASCPPKKNDWKAQIYAAQDGGWAPPGMKPPGGKK